MQRDILIAGFGGQGVMLFGQLLSITAAQTEGVNVTYFPAYGVEQRGGTANCYVVISDRRIGAPMSSRMDDLVVMNNASLERFLPGLRPGGRLFINSDIATGAVERDDISVYPLQANTLAEELGNPKGANLVLLGAYIGCTGLLPKERVLHTIREKLGKKRPELAAGNEAAFQKGYEIGATNWAGR